jgi:uncharacterized protein (TIGR00369 family)
MLPEMTDADPAARYWAIGERSVAQGFIRTMGVELVAMDEGYCEMRLQYGPHLTHGLGFFHGGVVGTLADVATATAGATMAQPDHLVLTVEYKVNMMATPDGDALVVRAKVIRAGRRTIIAQADVYAERDGQETHCAVALATLLQTANRR